MGILEDDDRKQIRELFAELVDPVKLLLFTQDKECQHCATTREIVEELAKLSDKVTAEICDLVADAARAKAHGVDKVPAVVVIGKRDQGIRFFGVPAGYEFTTLVETIIAVSRGEHGLSDDVLAELAKVDQPVRLEVLITPT